MKDFQLKGAELALSEAIEDVRKNALSFDVQAMHDCNDTKGYLLTETVASQIKKIESSLSYLDRARGYYDELIKTELA